MNKVIVILMAVVMVLGFSGAAMAQEADADAAASATAINSTANIVSPNVIQGQANNIGITMEGDAAAVQRDLTSVNNNGHGYRGFGVPHDIPIVPQGPAYFGTATPGPLFQSMKTALIHKNVFTIDEIKRMEGIPNPLGDAPDALSDTITVLIDKPAGNAKLLGYITVKGKSKKRVSIDALADAALKAHKMGGNAIHITSEGVQRQLKSFGWGVGMAQTVSSISEDETLSGITSGGFGVSGGHSGYVDFPWLQLFVLVVE